MSSLSSLPPLHEDWQSMMQVPGCFWHMFEQQVGCDVIFLVGVHQERVGAHSMVLMGRSSVFFQDFFAGVPDTEILLPEVEPENFKVFMRFLYTGQLGEQPLNHSILMSVSEKYNVSDLLKLLLNMKLHEMTVDDFCPFIRKFQGHMIGAMKFKCLEYVFKQPEAVFKSQHFPVLPHSFLQEILQSPYLVAEEEVICTGVLLWASKACQERGLEVTGENQRKVLDDLIFEVRFPVLNRDFFTENISEKGLLTDTEEVKILKYLLNPAKKPEQIKFKIEMRQSPESPFSYTPELCHGNLEGATGGPDVTKGAIRPNDSMPILHTLHSGRQGIIERFTEQSTGWGYRGNKKDAIAFTVDKDIRIDYIFVYGNCKEDGTIGISLVLKDNYIELSKTDIKVQCSVRTPYYEIGLENSSGTYGIHLQANTEYHIILGVKGDTGYYGKSGHHTVQSEGVRVHFKKSRYSTNNTSIQIGQIAGFRFTVLSEEEVA